MRRRRRRRVCVYAQQVYARVRATGMIRARATARTGARTHAHVDEGDRRAVISPEEHVAAVRRRRARREQRDASVHSTPQREKKQSFGALHRCSCDCRNLFGGRNFSAGDSSRSFGRRW